MNESISNQINKVNMFLNLAKEELRIYEDAKIKYEEWDSKEDKKWSDYPGMVPKSKPKRLMLMLREEMIKLDKML